MTTATIKPFSMTPAITRACRTGEERCAFCRQPVKVGSRTLMVRIVDGGDRFGAPGETVDAAGDLGFYPVGSDCARTHRAALKTFQTEIGA